MKFVLYADKLSVGSKPGGNPPRITPTFLEAGVYPVVRFFDNERVLVRVNDGYARAKYTILKLEDGELVSNRVN